MPHIQFYTGDWMKDPQLSVCSPATRGIWIDLICAMHEKDQCGELTGTSEQLSRLARCSIIEFENFVYEIGTQGAAEIKNQNGVWNVANRRMRKKAILRGKRVESGSKGGSKAQANREQKENRPDTDNDNDTERVITEYCTGLGLPQTDGAAVFAKWQGNDWTNGGQPIRDWRATIRSWKLQGYMPSQRSKDGGKAGFAKQEANLGWKRNYVAPAVSKEPATAEEMAVAAEEFEKLIGRKPEIK